MFKRLFGKKKMDLPQFNLPSDEACSTTDSGLKYVEVREGEGAPPASTDAVEVHYAGWTTEGELFDASYTRGQTASFPLQNVIKGWTEGLQLMKVGSAYTFVIPPHLAYGARGAPPAIGPNATLVFHVELISVK
jgi:FKBP-type peptidyl-prolyl cis-trans isomerase